MNDLSGIPWNFCGNRRKKRVIFRKQLGWTASRLACEDSARHDHGVPSFGLSGGGGGGIVGSVDQDYFGVDGLC